MAKSRPRKKRPQSQRRTRAARTTQAAGAGENQRRFTLSGWALVAQVLGQRPERTALLDLLGVYDWLGDSNLSQIKRSRPPLPCRPGCAYCCYVGPERPDLLAPELLRIVEYLRQDRYADTLAIVQARLLDDTYATRTERSPCLFLIEERCQVYPIRPMRCRAQHSADRDACERHYLGKQTTMPLLREPALLYKSLQIGMRLGLRVAGLQDERLALDGALRLVLLENENAFREWLAGEPVFKGIAFPEEVGEGELLAQLQQGARGDMRAETTRLAGLITSLRTQPGAWGLYPLTGQIPRI
jgi:Fe-S-cluster containining protein